MRIQNSLKSSETSNLEKLSSVLELGKFAHDVDFRKYRTSRNVQGLKNLHVYPDSGEFSIEIFDVGKFSGV